MITKRITWRGREWKISWVGKDDGNVLDLMDEKYAMIVGASAHIFVREDMSDDAAIMSIIHEIGHEMFPEWKAEPADTSKSEIGVLERDLPAFLVACGVDLTPILPGARSCGDTENSQ